MSEIHDNDEVHCGLCSGEERTCAGVTETKLKGGWFVITSMLVFILPLIMSITGSLVLGQTYLARFLGGLSGLLCGLLTAYIFSKLIERNLNKE